ncbi:ATP-binding cassette domain-containing protein [Ramlibacter henchirensis]|uniref:ATP-binding cassette domain-containing protein n=1 Tax=Ramlibacter henchirensis TaxID=204072 RepID=A0A4Z0C2E1_9BURK|nr:ATP-binding cassette domain-containing protein [Ramlibacter henchirensis]TFZ05381.1 ATP-binding cassette domain-containing protein [Ramlibacter henchirensis]
MQPVKAIEARDLRFSWPGQPECLSLPALDLDAGSHLFVHGPSGSGKSTLLSLLAGVLTPQAGSVSVLGQSWTGLRRPARDRFRADHIGYIFQQFNLLPYLPVVGNVTLPCKLSRRRAARAEAAGGVLVTGQLLLRSLGIGPELWDRPAAQLSVGQQQRVAAARALIGQPELVIADEPTSALDAQRREGFMHLLLAACGRAGSALVFVSHDERLATHFARSVSLAREDAAQEHVA